VDYYFWRDKTGHEIDLLGAKATTLLAIEIKAGKTVNSDYFTDLSYFSKIQTSQKKVVKYVVYGGDTTQQQQKQGTIILGKNAFLHGLSEPDPISIG